jgi:[acyl-carrier-protein] S-malonyltransferase
MSKTAIIFPGQGSQTKGMLGDFAADSATKELFAKASEALGYDLFTLVQEDPENKLNETQYTQPALLVTSFAFWQAVEKSDTDVKIMAGHSLGEYTALLAAGVIDFVDAVRLVARRGELMQAAVPAGTGAMAAILGLDDTKVEQACRAAEDGEVVSAVNYNSPGQVVIAGNKAAVARAIEKAKALGAKRALELPVSVPSHCALMQPAADQLATYLQNIEFKSPNIPVVNNVDVKVETDPAAIKDALVRQLFKPVKWVGVVEHIAGTGITEFVECGPGKVLAGLSKRIVKDIPCESFASVLRTA